jgi:hypothetical protein
MGHVLKNSTGDNLYTTSLALFVNLRESEVVFNLELRQDLRIEQAGNLADQSTEQHAEAILTGYFDPLAPSSAPWRRRKWRLSTRVVAFSRAVAFSWSSI